MKLKERLIFEVRDWKRCHRYHRYGNGKHHRHVKLPAARGGALVLERTALPRKATLTLAVVSVGLLYILIFGGIL